LIIRANGGLEFGPEANQKCGFELLTNRVEVAGRCTARQGYSSVDGDP
jgi:predicted Zn-ribbon and HTH transcriptional regulator